MENLYGQRQVHQILRQISPAGAEESTAARHQAGNPMMTAAGNQARKLPPVFLVTSATIFAATASIS